MLGRACGHMARRSPNLVSMENLVDFIQTVVSILRNLVSLTPDARPYDRGGETFPHQV